MLCRPVYCAGVTPALNHAKNHLKELGIPLTDAPRWDTGHLLLDVPSFRPGSVLSEEGNLDTLLSSLPRDVTVWGGNLNHPALDGFHTMDLLQYEQYLTENAAITAQCTIKLVSPMLTSPWQETPTLIIGWGRIGKFLAQQLNNLGCPVTVSARSANDLSKLQSLGYKTVETAAVQPILSQFRLIINTVPALVVEDSSISGLLKIDLASQKGISGEDVVWARGLPGIHTPERSGKLIADTFLRLLKEVTP